MRPFGNETPLGLGEGRVFVAGTQMLQMKVDDEAGIAHEVGGKTDIGAIKVKSAQIVGEADAGAAAHDDEVFVEALNACRQSADVLIGAMRVADAQGEAARRAASGVSRHRPVWIARIELVEPVIERIAAIGDEPDVLMTQDHDGAVRFAKQAVEPPVGATDVAFAIVDNEEFERTKMPVPLAFDAKNLRETQPVFIFGFPLADAIGKNI